MKLTVSKSTEVIWTSVLGSDGLLCTCTLLAFFSSIFNLTWSSLEEEEENSNEEEKDSHDCQLVVGESLQVWRYSKTDRSWSSRQKTVSPSTYKGSGMERCGELGGRRNDWRTASSLPVTVETGDVWRCCNLTDFKMPDLSNDQIMVADLSSQITLGLQAPCQLGGCARWGHRIGGGGRWVPVIRNTVNRTDLLMPHGSWPWSCDSLSSPQPPGTVSVAGQLACKAVWNEEATNPPPWLQERIRASVLAWVGVVGLKLKKAG